MGTKQLRVVINKSGLNLNIKYRLNLLSCLIFHKLKIKGKPCEHFESSKDLLHYIYNIFLTK